MIWLIPIILIVFIVLLAFIWGWFFRNEAALCDGMYLVALEKLGLSDFKAAKDLFFKTVLINAGYKDAKYNLGICQLMLEEYENAKTTFEQMLKAAPKNYNAMVGLAKTFHKLGRDDSAIENYNKALKEKPKSLECFFGLGLISFEKEDYAEALDYFNKAKEITPENVDVLFYIARCEEELCDVEDEDACHQIIENYLSIANTENLPQEFNRVVATLYAKIGKIEEALAFCRKALTVNTEDIDAYALLGLIQFVKKDLVGAKNSLSIALSLQPGNEGVHEILSYVLCQQKNKCAMKECREKYYELIKKFIK